MATFRSNVPEEAGKWLKDIDKQVRAAVRRAAVRTALLGERRIKGIVEKEAYDTGRGLRSVTSEVREAANEIRMLLGSNLDYMLDVEFGRKPGKWPNLDAIVKWCGRQMRRQGINARVNVSFEQLQAMAKQGSRGHKPATAVVARQQLTMVYLVGRKIATKGIKQKLIFKRIETALLTYFRQETAKELKSVR